MSDEQFYVSREVVEYDDEDEQVQEQEHNEENETVFDNEFRILILANSSVSGNEEGSTKVSVEESDMEEILVRAVRTLNDVNEFFDNFDAKIAEPNDGHLKYEVGSDGLCVVLVDTIELKNKVVEFVNQFMDSHPIDDEKESSNKNSSNNEDERDAKRRR